MTTNVIIKTHAWPVQVETADKHVGQGSSFVTVVPPQSEQTHYLTSSRTLTLTELPVPAETPAD